MNVIVNGVLQVVHEQAVLQDVLLPWINAGNIFAVACNHVVVPKTQYADKQLQDNDLIHILIPMQGG